MFQTLHFRQWLATLLITSAPNKLFVCFLSDYPILRSIARYPNDEQFQPRARCAECGLQLCTLAQLRAAYEAGFRHSGWHLYDTKDRLAKVTPCGEWHYENNLCYFVVHGNYTKSLIPNNRKPGWFGNPICCQKCQVDTSK